ncbi:SCO2400 family protein [Streptomyces sp. NPDC001135]
MDYCSSCRRHLNGALVCPGCGAYAPDIAPPGTDGFGTESLGATAGVPFAPPADATFTPPAGTTDAPPADVKDAPPAPRGRAARRRQRARWKKSQRRAVVATAVALVGGGLTLASLDRGAGDRAQAATAPDHRGMGLTDEPSAAPSHPASTPAPPATTHHRVTPATPAVRTAAVDVPRQQTLTPVSRTVRSAGRPHTAVTVPHPAAPAAPAAPQPRTTTPSSSGTSTGTGTGTSGSGGSSAGTSGSGTATQPTSSTGSDSTASSGGTSTTPATGSTSHDQLCLVLVCLG